MASIIYNDLKESKYIVKYADIEFTFSSEFYMNKFNRIKNHYLKNESDKMMTKYKVPIFADYVILLELYKSIEKRGFRVFYKNEILENYRIEMDIKM